MSIVKQQLLSMLSQYPQIRLAILFGSQVSGNPRPDSDIDLGLLCESSISPSFRQELIETIAELGRPVDIVDLYNAGEPILGEVFKGIRILGEDAVYAKLLSRHLIDAADFLPLRQRILRERREAWIG